MAVHPHLPILAVGSMGQVRCTHLHAQLSCLIRCRSGCSHVFRCNWRISTPNSVRCPLRLLVLSTLLLRSRLSDRILILAGIMTVFWASALVLFPALHFIPSRRVSRVFSTEISSSSATHRGSVTIMHHSASDTLLQRTLAAGAIDCIVSLYGAQVFPLSFFNVCPWRGMHLHASHFCFSD